MRWLKASLSILGQAGYSTTLVDRKKALAHFEDHSLLGLVREYRSVTELVSHWRSEHDEFLTSNAERIRRAADKSWNLYCVLLTSDECSTEQRKQIISIEENMVATRKLVRHSILSEDDLVRALLPLLPIQNTFAVVEDDLVRRLKSRWELGDQVQDAILSGASIDDIVRLLLEDL